MTFNNNPQPMRALPCNVPTNVAIKVYPAEFYDNRRGIYRQQWQATYRPADARDLRDLFKVVVNFYHNQEPQSGENWEVKMLHRAPKSEIIFANALRRIDLDPAPVETEVMETSADLERPVVTSTKVSWLVEMASKFKQLVNRFQRD